MSQVGREQRQPTVDLDTGTMPVQERQHRIAVSKVMWAGPGALACPLEPDLTNQPLERVMNRGAIESLAGLRDEERRRLGLRPVAITHPGIA